MKINMFITLDCNMDCSYCYVKNKRSKYMDESIALKTVDLALSMTAKDERLNLVFQGGEPTLNWDVLKSTVEYTKKKTGKFGFAITTNGVLLDSNMMEYLDKNAFQLRLSVDGAKESNDRNRRFKNDSGTFSYLSEALGYFKEYTGGRKFIRSTICENNAKSLYDDMVFFLEQGIFEIVMSLNVLDKWSDKSLDELDDCICRLADYYVKNIKMKKGMRVLFFDDIIEMTMRNRKKNEIGSTIREKNESFCGLGCRSFAVSPDGSIYTCSLLVGNDTYIDEKCGHVLEEKVQPSSLKYDYCNQTVCHECALQRRCYNNCITMNRMGTDSFYKPSYAHCRFQKSLIINTDKIINALMPKSANQ